MFMKEKNALSIKSFKDNNKLYISTSGTSEDFNKKLLNHAARFPLFDNSKISKKGFDFYKKGKSNYFIFENPSKEFEEKIKEIIEDELSESFEMENSCLLSSELASSLDSLSKEMEKDFEQRRLLDLYKLECLDFAIKLEKGVSLKEESFNFSSITEIINSFEKLPTGSKVQAEIISKILFLEKTKSDKAISLKVMSLLGYPSNVTLGSEKRINGFLFPNKILKYL